MPPKVSFEDNSNQPIRGEFAPKSYLVRYSFVRSVLEENEDMLREIDKLREMVTKQTEELISAQRHISYLESLIILQDTKDKNVSNSDVENNSVSTNINTTLISTGIVVIDKINILRSILSAILAYQFSGCYTRARTKNWRQNKDIMLQTKYEKNMLEQTLRESNIRLNEVYRLLQSYQDTPSFSVTAYDQLLIESMMHIIALSKTLNAMALEGQGSPAEKTTWILSAYGNDIHNTVEPNTPLLPPKPVVNN